MRVDGAARAARLVEVRNAYDSQAIVELLPKATDAIGQLAPLATIERIARSNADALWLFWRKGRERPDGFQAFLLLNAEGYEALLDGGLDLYDPDPRFLVGQSEPPACAYVWATFTPGILSAGIATTFDHFSAPRYANADLVSQSATIRGHRAMVRWGFQEGMSFQGEWKPNFYVFSRTKDPRFSQRRKFDTLADPANGTGIKVVHGLDEFLRIAAVRAAVFVGEQACPFDEEFDGNDFAATHLLYSVKGEPAGCMRIRFFGDFAKMERLAVRKEFRQSRIAFELVRAAVDLCRTKGFRKLYGHAREDYLPFWQRFGFRMKDNGEPFDFSGHVFLEMVDEGDTPTDSLRMEDSPYRLIRPEGQWDRPGVLERSSGATP